MEQNSKKTIWRVAAITAGLAAVAGGTWWVLTKRQNGTDAGTDLDALLESAQAANPKLSTLTANTNTNTTIPATGGSSPAGFPVKRGDRNELVRQLQHGLLANHPGQLPGGFSADGIFGKLTERGLRNNGYPTVVDAGTFQRITGMSSTAAGTSLPSAQEFDAVEISKQLHFGIDFNRWTTAKAALDRITSASEYQLVRNRYITKLTYLLKRGTPVTMLLKRFPGKRHELEASFYRIGLTKDETGKWQMPQGLSAPPPVLATIAPATVWDGKHETMRVPANTILGTYVQTRDGWTTFRTQDGAFLLIRERWTKGIPTSRG